jgi:hypothetical protein
MQDDDIMKLTFGGETIAYIDTINNTLPKFRFYEPARAYVTLAIPSEVDDRTWHRRFGYMNYRSISETPKVVEGMKINGDLYKEATCHSCLIGK